MFSTLDTFKERLATTFKLPVKPVCNPEEQVNEEFNGGL